MTYAINKVRKSGALEVYVVNGNSKSKVFSRIDSGNWLDDNEIKKTVEIIKKL